MAIGLPTTGGDYASAISRAMDMNRRELARLEGTALLRLYDHWMRAERRILERLNELQARIDAHDGPMRRSWVIQLDQFKGLVAQIRTELDDLEAVLKDAVATGGRQAIEQGIDRLTTDIAASLTDRLPEGLGTGAVSVDGRAVQVMGTTFPIDAPAPKAIRVLSARLQLARSPLGKRLAKEFGDDAAKIINKLINGLVQGQNPRVIARDMSRGLQMPRYRAERIARTEILTAYRESHRATMQANSDVVNGWMWMANIWSCCGGCLAMHGTTHKLDEPLSSHPSCRCQAVPRVASWAELGMPELGDDSDAAMIAMQRKLALQMIHKSTKDELQQRFGKSKAEVLHSGRVKLDDLVSETKTKLYGVTRTEATTGQLLSAAGLKVTGGGPLDQQIRAALRNQ